MLLPAFFISAANNAINAAANNALTAESPGSCFKAYAITSCSDHVQI